jgi:3-isopropylmalate/(R)-2-methylmalate dehydratase small subunit
MTVSAITGTALPFARSDVDTDQIIPKQFLTQVSRSGWGEHLFSDWRAREALPFDDPRYRTAVVLVTGPNFGCGSSREQAVWALQQWGFQAVLAPSFAPIFEQNCARAGLLAVQAPHSACQRLATSSSRDAQTIVTIDLHAQRVSAPGVDFGFPLSARARRVLVDEIDEIEQTLRLLREAQPYRAPDWFPDTTRLRERT